MSINLAGRFIRPTTGQLSGSLRLLPLRPAASLPLLPLSPLLSLSPLSLSPLRTLTTESPSRFISSPTGFAAEKPLTLEEYNLKLRQTISFFTAREKPLVLQNVLSICAAMKRHGIKPNVRTYNSLLEALATKNQVHMALKMFDEMLKQDLKPDINTMNLLLKIHVPFGDFMSAMNLFELFDKFSLLPDSETFLHLIGIASNSPKHNVKAEALVYEMLDRKLYTAEAGSKAIETLIYSQLASEANNVMKRIESEQGKISTQAYSSLLQGFCLVDNNEGVNHCFEVLKGGKLNDVVLDEGLILLIMQHASRVGDLELAHRAFLALEEIKPVYQDFHFLPLLDILAQKGNFYRLFEIVLLMKSMGLNLKLKHFNSVVLAIGRSPDSMDKAYFALEDLKAQKPLDVLVFNIVLAGCSQGRDLDRTFATFSEAKNLGLTPTLDSYHKLLDVCFRTRQGKVAERVWRDMEAEGLEPVAESFSRYVDIHLACGNLSIAREAFEVACSKGMRMHDSVYSHTILKFTKIDKAFADRVTNILRGNKGLIDSRVTDRPASATTPETKGETA